MKRHLHVFIMTGSLTIFNSTLADRVGYDLTDLRIQDIFVRVRVTTRSMHLQFLVNIIG